MLLVAFIMGAAWYIQREQVWRGVRTLGMGLAADGLMVGLLLTGDPRYMQVMTAVGVGVFMLAELGMSHRWFGREE